MKAKDLKQSEWELLQKLNNFEFFTDLEDYLAETSKQRIIHNLLETQKTIMDIVNKLNLEKEEIKKFKKLTPAEQLKDLENEQLKIKQKEEEIK